MHAGFLAADGVPVIQEVFVKRGQQHFIQRLGERLARLGEHLGDLGQGGDAAFLQGGIAGEQDHAGQQRSRAFDPVIFIVAVALRVGQHVRDVLGIGHVARCPESDFRERVELRTHAHFDRGKFEDPVARVPLSPPSGERIVLALDVVHHA